jgi:glycosyltransferase involved in cell wall biosynthesis
VRDGSIENQSVRAMKGSALVRSKNATQPGLRILLAQRACAERYPPLLHQAALLSALDPASVRVLDAIGQHEEDRVQTGPHVERVRVRAVDNSTRGTAIANALWATRFANEFRRQLAMSPDVAIAFEPDAAAFLLWKRFGSARTMRVVHLHEIPDKRLYVNSVVSKIAIRYMLSALNRADLVIVPDEKRAIYAMEAAKLERHPLVVMNCPPIINHLPASKLLPWLAQRGIRTTRIVHFQGSLGHDRALAKVIASMHLWPLDAVFVLVGDGPMMVQRELREVAAREGVLERVLFVGRVPYVDVSSFAVGASVGVTLLEPINTNLEFCAGASNKRFEYAALGIPQVSNTGAGMRRLFESPGIAMLVNVADAAMIGQTITQLLLNSSLASSIGERARSLHLSRYNYEGQFAPVVERINDWISACKAAHT